MRLSKDLSHVSHIRKTPLQVNAVKENAACRQANIPVNDWKNDNKDSSNALVAKGAIKPSPYIPFYWFGFTIIT